MSDSVFPEKNYQGEMDGSEAVVSAVAAEPTSGVNIAPSEPIPQVKRRWLSNIILTFSLFADNNESGIVSTLFALIRAEFGLSLSALGILTAMGKIIAAIFGPLWSILARRYNRKLVLVVATVVFGLWTIAIGFAQNYTQFLILFAIATIGTVSATPIMTEIIGDLFRDNERGRAIGFVYGALALAGSLTTPLLGQLANVPHGWRVAYYIIGGVMAISGLVILVGVYDPGRGATEAGRARTANQSAQISSLKWSEVKQLFTIPSYILMLVSRILSGHLLLQSFGIVYMVTVLHFSTAQAAVAYGGSYFGYTVGTFVGGFVVDQLNKWSPSYGRVLSLQLAQALFAVVALFMLIFSGNNMGLVIAFFFVLFFLQGVNPGINRPIVYSVTPPALRGAAFAVMVSIVESIGWAIYNLLAGFLGDIFGLQAIFFVVLVVLMVANAAVIFLLYRTYWPDVQRLQAQLAEQQMSAEGA